MLCDKRCLPYVIRYTRTIQSSGSWRRRAKQYVFFINFKPLELYWTYLLALQTTTPKISLKRLISLDHKSKMRWRTLGFVVNWRKYRLLLKKLLAMSRRKVILVIIPLCSVCICMKNYLNLTFIVEKMWCSLTIV